MKKYNLELIVFLCGLAVMILELDGSRILAPYFGTSLYVWTSLIGVILGSLSLGYWLGGKLADKKATYSILAAIILVPALYIGLSAFIKEPVLSFYQKQTIDLRISSVIAALSFFLVPNIFLGMVSPYAVKLKMKSLDLSGRTVGNLYAVSTIGSIAGTFLAGFYLIPVFGNTQVAYITATVLLLASALSFAGKLVFVQSAGLILLVGCFLLSHFQIEAQAKVGKLDFDSQYNRIKIYPTLMNGKAVRFLSTDPFGIQSAVYLDGSPDLVFDYTKFYQLGNYFNPEIKIALMIGGGAYTYPRYFLARNPNANIDVVEIDPKVTSLAREYFGLKNDPKIKIISQDGRIYLNQSAVEYDSIFVDAFKSITPPYQLTTKEAVEKMRERLSPKGLVMVNIVSAIEGPKNKFFAAEYSTFKSIFPQVYVFQMGEYDPGTVQNLMLIALKSDDKPSMKSDVVEYQNDLKNLYQGNIPAGKILTDNYSPVENLTLNLY